MSQHKAHWDDGGNNVQKQGPGDMLMDQKKSYPVTTVGAGVIPAEAILSGIVDRSGPTAGFTDTFPSAAALLAACPMLGRGDSFEFLYINGVAFAMTAAAAAGSADTLTNANVASSAVRRYMVTVLADGQPLVASAATTNGQAAVQLNNLLDAKSVRPGMAVSGTGISGGTTVIAVNANTGVVTLSGNATATNGIVGLTFQPQVNYRGLYSATA